MSKLTSFSGFLLLILFCVSCQKKPVPPVLSTSPVTEISANGAVSGGIITDEGGAPVTARGVCWGTSTDPTIAGNKTSDDGTGTFSSNLTQLLPHTVYFVRAYATNSAGTGYGESLSFTTLGAVPVPISANATGITINSATLNGTVNPNALQTTVSFEWGTTINFGQTATPAQSTVSGTNPVNITFNLASLTPGTTYHYRIKATNELGTAYSDISTFSTLGNLPSVSGSEASGIGLNMANLNGTVNPNHLSTTVSFEWGTTVNYGNNSIPAQSQADGSSPVSFTVYLSGLTPGLTYHYRIVATNVMGTSRSSDMTFSTYAVADAENNLYHSVNIGTQVWLTENLKTTKYNDGTSIPLITAQDQWIAAGGNAYCWYDNNISNKEIYGALYNWRVIDYTLNGNKKVCPAGWHVPTKAEFGVLLDYLVNNGYGYEGSGDDIGKAVAATTGWNPDPTPGSIGNNMTTNNRSGFSAVGGGMRTHGEEGFIQKGIRGSWWALPDDFSAGFFYWCVDMFNFEGTVRRANIGWNAGLSVRCLKD